MFIARPVSEASGQSQYCEAQATLKKIATAIVSGDLAFVKSLENYLVPLITDRNACRPSSVEAFICGQPPVANSGNVLITTGDPELAQS